MDDAVTFETYPPMFSDYENYIENENYDNEIRIFDVPKVWAVDWIFIQYRMGFDEFMDEYTWDDTFQMYEQAMKAGVLLRDTIETR